MASIDRYTCISVESGPFGLQAVFKGPYGNSYAPLEPGGEHA
jgi:hypothetical protein